MPLLHYHYFVSRVFIDLFIRAMRFTPRQISFLVARLHFIVYAALPLLPLRHLPFTIYATLPITHGNNGT